MQPFTKVATRQQILDGYANLFKKKAVRVLCLYNSGLDLLIKESDADLMMIPIDDKMANRAHGAAETTNIRNYRFFDLDQHINRLERTAQLIGIQLPLTKDVIASKFHDLAHLAYKTLEEENYPNLRQQILVMRVLLSAGHGDFGIYSHGKQPILYAAVYIPNLPLTTLYQGVEEHVHKDLWLNKEYLAQAKTVNYLSNTIMADYSKARGGYQGIRLDTEGHLLEGAIANIAYVLNDGTFAYPPIEKTIIGTTLNAALKIANNEMIPNNIIPQIAQVEVLLSEATQKIKELFFLQGEKIIPVLKLDGNPIGDGQIGPVTKYLQSAIKEEQKSSGEVIKGFEDKE